MSFEYGRRGYIPLLQNTFPHKLENPNQRNGVDWAEGPSFICLASAMVNLGIHGANCRSVVKLTFPFVTWFYATGLFCSLYALLFQAQFTDWKNIYFYKEILSAIFCKKNQAPARSKKVTAFVNNNLYKPYISDVVGFEKGYLKLQHNDLIALNVEYWTHERKLSVFLWFLYILACNFL